VPASRTRLAALSLIIAVLGSTGAAIPASASSLSDAQRDLLIINRARNDLQTSLEKAQGQQVALENELQQTRDLIRTTLDEIQKTEARLRELDVQIAALLIRIAETRADLHRKKTALGDFLRVNYKQSGDVFSSLLASSSFTDFLNRSVVLQHVSFVGHVLIERVHQEELRLQREEEELKAKRAEAEKQRAALVEQREQLEKLQKREEQVLADLQRSIGRVRWELKAIDGQSAALAKRIAELEIERQAQIIAEAQATAWEQAQIWMKQHLPGLPPISGPHSTKYPLVWPERIGEISLGFGPCAYPFEPPGFGYPHFHSGIDVAAPSGTPIYAADDGVVIAATKSMVGTQLVGYGNYVIIAHRNNFASLYAHLTAYVVQTGDVVHQNQVIGLEGSTGNSTGPHVHFEYRYNGVPTNPAPYLPPNGPNPFAE
jgi:murein DD-endopeptidase MepM/ murein hydrolase activator NlpD